jgi:Spy/CpxP family protein refolding chaperone
VKSGDYNEKDDCIKARNAKTQPLRKSLKATCQKMKEATANGAFDEARVTALAAERAGLSAQMTDERLRIKSQTFALLTAEQKVKAAEIKATKKERHKGKRMNRKGGSSAPAGTEM